MAEHELLELAESGGPEPGVHSCYSVLEAMHRDAEPAAGARVGVNDSRHHTIGEATTVEVERRGGPNVPPPGREDLGAGAFLGAEERDDLAKDGVDASVVFISYGRRLDD